MHRLLPSLRQALFVAAAVFACNGVATASLLPSNARIDSGRLYIPANVAPAGIAVLPTTDPVDTQQWNFAGDADANDVALFRPLLVATSHDGEAPELATLAIVLLLAGGIAHARRQIAETRQARKRWPSFGA